MKKILLFVLAIGLMTGCKKISEKIKSLADIYTTIDYSEQVQVPGLPDHPFVPPQGLNVSLLPYKIKTNATQHLKENNTSPEFVQKVTLKSFDIQMLQPSSQNFDLVDSIWLYVGGNGLEERLAAYKFDIPKGIRTLELESTGFDMKDYFLQDSLTFKLQGHFYNEPDSTTVFEYRTAFEVVANLLDK